MDLTLHRDPLLLVEAPFRPSFDCGRAPKSLSTPVERELTSLPHLPCSLPDEHERQAKLQLLLTFSRVQRGFLEFIRSICLICQTHLMLVLYMLQERSNHISLVPQLVCLHRLFS